MIESFDFKSNFWDQNPNIKYLSPFGDLYSEDKSKGKTNSSDFMWALILYFDLENSPYKRMENKDKEEEIKKFWFPEIDFDKIKEFEIAFSDSCLSYAQKVLLFWRTTLEERNTYMKSLVWGKDTDEKEKLLKTTHSLWNEYRKAEEAVEKENSLRVQNDRTESLSEKGEI